jgi:hypothetical protein
LRQCPALMRIAIFLAALLASFPLAAQEQERACKIESSFLLLEAFPPFLKGCQEGDSLLVELDHVAVAVAVIHRFCDIQSQIVTSSEWSAVNSKTTLVMCRYKPRPLVEGEF